MMWMATRNVHTPVGWMPRGRLVGDGDPALEGAAEGDWVRVVEDGSPVEIVEEATAEPGRVRRTSRARKDD